MKSYAHYLTFDTRQRRALVHIMEKVEKAVADCPQTAIDTLVNLTIMTQHRRPDELHFMTL